VSGPVTVTPAVLRECPPPEPDGHADKHERGTALVIGGSTETPGAVVLAGIAALRAGAGVLQIATVASAAGGVAAAVPEARVIGLPENDHGGIAATGVEAVREAAGKAASVLVGPGLMHSDPPARLLAALWPDGAEGPLVLDAGALTAAAEMGSRAKPLVLTPNFTEMAELRGTSPAAVGEDPLASAAAVSAEHEATVLLRGGETWIVSAGRVHLDQSGSPGLATSGSGDVLAGYLAGLLARGTDAHAAALWAVHVHAAAGRRMAARLGALGYLARELLDELPAAAAELAG
jgi:ADP-dependent NAD(P)H-hydrate dehydratase